MGLWLDIVAPGKDCSVFVVISDLARYLRTDDASSCGPILDDLDPARIQSVCPRGGGVGGPKVDANYDALCLLHQTIGRPR